MLTLRRFAVPVASICLALFVGCSSTSDAEPAAESPDSSAELAATSLRGLRYCEVLLLNLTEAGLQAEVYNTYPLNDCPNDTWMSLDGGAIAAAEGVPFALLNGPRFWLMDFVQRLDDGSVIKKTFTGSAGAMEMNRYAVVTIGTPDTIGRAYTPQAVERKSRFTFRSGSQVFVLTDAEGQRYVMQSWSQQRDSSLTEAGLDDLGSRLDLPVGWTFSVEILESDLEIDSTGAPAQVFQDELMNTYSLIPD